MTKDEARIVLLEQALVQAQHTVEFLHSCLTLPEHYKYSYPDQTTREMGEWKKLVPPPEMCVHSGHQDGCKGCDNHRVIVRQRVKAKEVLGIT